MSNNNPYDLSSHGGLAELAKPSHIVPVEPSKSEYESSAAESMYIAGENIGFISGWQKAIQRCREAVEGIEEERVTLWSGSQPLVITKSQTLAAIDKVAEEVGK